MSDYEERVIENLRADLAAARIELARVYHLILHYQHHHGAFPQKLVKLAQQEGEG